MPGISTFYTFYDDVRVPASALVGGENQGWQLITTQLNFERAALGNLGALEPLFEKTLEWATTTELDGKRVIDQPWVQLALARVEAQVAAYRLAQPAGERDDDATARSTWARPPPRRCSAPS